MVIVLTGAICTGKSTVARHLHESAGMEVVSSRELICDRLPIASSDRSNLRGMAAQLDSETDGGWLVDAVKDRCVVDSVRTKRQLERLRAKFPSGLFHVHLLCSDQTKRKSWWELKIMAGEESNPDIVDAADDPVENRVESFARAADLVVDSCRNTTQAMAELVLAISKAACGGRVTRGFVDVMCGGQWGSEGKGQIAAHIAGEYDVLCRVGGPNAGHSTLVNGRKFVFHHLPSGSIVNQSARIVLAAGSVISPDALLSEISASGIDERRVVIHPNASIIDRSDMLAEDGLRKGIGSTAQGVGSSTARRIMERSERWDTRKPRVASESSAVRRFIGDVDGILGDALRTGGSVFCEGTQGVGLSLLHGSYPYVTSRDTTTQGVLSEAGIPASFLRKSILVFRSYPIRVESPAPLTSGPMGLEIDWETVSARSGIDLADLRSAELTSTTKRQRRVAEFDWPVFIRSCTLCRPTEIALTFADYIDASLHKTKDVNHPAVKWLVSTMESASGASVRWVGFGFGDEYVVEVS